MGLFSKKINPNTLDGIRETVRREYKARGKKPTRDQLAREVLKRSGALSIARDVGRRR